jgi:isoleucyl-tRNA synthetase
MALGARAGANIKVRQPLALARLALPDESERGAAEKYADVITEEINVKALEFVANNDELVEHAIRPNLSRIGKKYGKRTQAVKEALKNLDPAEAIAADAEDRHVTVDVKGETFELATGEFEIRSGGKEGWLVHREGDYSVALDGRLTEDLLREGRARDLVRHIQTHRKKAGLDVADRIHITYEGDGPLAEALDKEGTFIQGELLALSILQVQEPEGDYTTEIKISGDTIRVGIRKATD